MLRKEEKAAIYDNNNLEYLRENPHKYPHMAAYSGKDGFVYKDDKSTGENSSPRYTISPNNTILAVGRCTEEEEERWDKGY